MWLRFSGRLRLLSVSLSSVNFCGFRVLGLGFRFLGFWFRGLGFRVGLVACCTRKQSPKAAEEPLMLASQQPNVAILKAAQGLGFRVLWFRVQGSEIRGLGFRGLGFRV